MKIVAEIGLSHEGSLGTALNMIDACADAGADAVKFQCHTGDKQNRFREGTTFPQDSTRAEYWARTAFTPDEWEKLRDRARADGLEFAVSCFSMDAVRMMSRVGVDWWKVGSAQTSDVEMLSWLARHGKSIVISSGMSDFDELAMAFERAIKDGERWCELKEVTILQCCSEYPTPPEHVGLNVMSELRERFGRFGKVGLSDHSGTIWPGIVAAYLGADMLEVHVTFSRKAFGPDVGSSLTFEELEQLVRGVRFVERMTPVDKDEAAKSMDEMRAIFMEATNA